MGYSLKNGAIWKAKYRLFSRVYTILSREFKTYYCYKTLVEWVLHTVGPNKMGHKKNLMLNIFYCLFSGQDNIWQTKKLNVCCSTSLLLVTKGQRQTQLSPNIWLKTKPVQILLSNTQTNDVKRNLYNYHTSQKKKTFGKIYNILSSSFISEHISDQKKRWLQEWQQKS